MIQSESTRAYLRIAGGLLLVAVLLFGAASYFSYTPPAGSAPGVNVLVSQTGHMLVLRLPPGVSGQQQQIIVNERDADIPRRAVLLPVADAESSAPVLAQAQLTPEQWQPLDTLRRNWCFAPPLYYGSSAGVAEYDVALRCDLTTRRVKVPADDLPPELAALLQQVPAAEETTRR